MAKQQAVLLIHGIGEQRPMDSLRSFVRAVWTGDPSLHRDHVHGSRVWSKPYPLSQNYELRRLTTAENKAGLRTDFFELYWAHLMYGTRAGHLLAWAKTLLLRSPATVPQHLRLAYFALWILAIVGVFLGYQIWAAKQTGTSLMPLWLSALVTLVVVPAILGILFNIVGDAARYLHVAPGNVQRRHEIRAAGVEVLTALHARGDYERIVVVGHSLGSVIGYDILNYAWTRYNADTPRGTRRFAALDALEALAVKALSDPSIAASDIHAAQRALFDEMKGNESKWRVTDFITLGSPLAHAEILLAKNAADLRPKFVDRELPKSPPELEETTVDNKPVLRFSYPANAAERVPHHAAVFGPTRWTNLYSPNRLIMWGDLIGGPLRHIFGPGVLDVPVDIQGNMGLFTHTLYWTPCGDDRHLAPLRRALNLLDR